jgi:hypothetical protein
MYNETRGLVNKAVMCNKKTAFFLVSTILLTGCLALEEDKNPEARHQLEWFLTKGMKKHEFHSVFRRVVKEPIINEFKCTDLSNNEHCLGHSVVFVYFVEGKPTWNCGRLEVQLEAYFDKHENLINYITKRGKHCP